MRLETLRNLYVNQLREVYNAEEQIVAGLSKMEGAATNPQLKQAFKQHRVETENQIKRLDQIFGSLGESSSGNASKALTGLVAEGQEVITASGEADVIDAGLIGASQKIEHYEIACYGTLIAYARLLRDTQGEKLLQQNLNEEYATDKKLTALAESMVNAKAMQATGNYREGGSDGGVSVAGLLIGAAAGVAVGMLLAPNAGTDSRKKILDGANSLLDQLGGQFGGLADTVKSTLNQFAGQVQNGGGGSTTTQSTVKKNNNVKRSNGNGNPTPPASPTTTTTTLP
jgi:ferritin-like metal-binding protein YciE/gas vesicle protein